MIWKAFLKHINLPSLSQEDCALLNKDATLQELKETVRSLKAGKTPGLRQTSI